LDRLKGFISQSSQQTAGPEGRMTIAHGFNRGLVFPFGQSPAGAKEHFLGRILSPLRDLVCFGLDNPRLKPRAIFDRPSGALN
jgi:hypothetical protein